MFSKEKNTPYFTGQNKNYVQVKILALKKMSEFCIPTSSVRMSSNYNAINFLMSQIMIH